jgi:hypothetical protein
VRDSEIEAAIARCPTRTGTARMRRVLIAEGTSGFTRSEAERLLLALLRQAKLSPPETNVRLLGYEVDFRGGRSGWLLKWMGRRSTGTGGRLSAIGVAIRF